MRGVTTNAGEIARRYRLGARRLDNALASGLRKLARTVNRAQVANLSGSGQDAPGSYPVPVRSGHLRRSASWETEGRRAVIVFNSAEYAGVIHAGRPYLSDAARKVDPAQIIRDAVWHEAIAGGVLR